LFGLCTELKCGKGTNFGCYVWGYVLIENIKQGEIICCVCGDFNVNFFIGSSSAQQLTLHLQSYNLFHTTDFPPGTTKVSSSAMDNIFINYSRINSIKVFSLIYGLSDHEAQYLCVNNIFYWQTGNFRFVKKRLITKSAVSMFIEMWKNESWDNIINHTDVNESFNLFVNTFLIVFESCFPIQYVTKSIYNNHWITARIKVSCKCKNYLYIMSKTTNWSKINPNHLKYAVIEPCFKKGDKSQVSNYRTIPLLTGFSKIFELLILHRLKYHLVSNNILVNEQFGSCGNVSTDSTISKLNESIFNAWNNIE